MIDRLAPVLGAVLSVGVLASCAGAATGDRTVAIAVRYSAFSASEIRVPAGVPVTFRLVNDDPIDHEWIVGDEAVHAAHRTGSEPVHAGRPTEVSLPAFTTRATTLTFDAAGRFPFVCHLPGHEAYGMVGVVIVTAAG